MNETLTYAILEWCIGTHTINYIKPYAQSVTFLSHCNDLLSIVNDYFERIVKINIKVINCMGEQCSCACIHFLDIWVSYNKL